MSGMGRKPDRLLSGRRVSGRRVEIADIGQLPPFPKKDRISGMSGLGRKPDRLLSGRWEAKADVGGCRLSHKACSIGNVAAQRFKPFER